MVASSLTVLLFRSFNSLLLHPCSSCHLMSIVFSRALLVFDVGESPLAAKAASRTELGIRYPSPKTSPDCQDCQDMSRQIIKFRSIYLIAGSLYLSISCNPLVHSHLGEVYIVISYCFRLRFERLECQNFRAFFALNDHSDFADAQGLHECKEIVERWRSEVAFQSEDDKIAPKEKVWVCNIKS